MQKKDKYIDFDIPLYGGIITCNNLHSSSFYTLDDFEPVNGTEALDFAGEDLLAAKFEQDNIILDMSWCTSLEIEGGWFYTAIIPTDSAWEDFILGASCFSLADLKKLMHFLLRDYKPTIHHSNDKITDQNEPSSIQQVIQKIETHFGIIKYGGKTVFNAFNNNSGLNYENIENWSEKMFQAKFKNNTELHIGTGKKGLNKKEVVISLTNPKALYGKNESARHYDGKSHIITIFMNNTFTFNTLQQIIDFLLKNYAVNDNS